MTVSIARNRYLALLLAIGMAAGPAWAQRPTIARDETQGFTEPIKRVQMNFPGIGVIKSVPVKEGQMVRKGDVLMVQDKEIEEAELERLMLEANSTARMDFAKADRDVKKLVYERLMAKREGFSQIELEQAKLDWDRSEAQIKVVAEDQQNSAIRVKQQQAKLDRMTLRSEVDGVVEAIKMKEGELSSLDPEKPAIIVVQKDVLRVVLTRLLSEQVAKLEIGETLDVRYLDETNWRQARVTFKTPFADAASGNQVVWLELPNPDNKDAGRHVVVKLPSKLLDSTMAPLAMPR